MTVPTDKPSILEETPDFSLVLGGPLFQLFRKARLSGSALELLRRRIWFFLLVTWLPLLVLSILGGCAWGGGIQVPFLHDIDAHARFLVALPALIIAELVVHMRIRTTVRQFTDRGIVTKDDTSQFHEIIHASMGVRNSVFIEAALLVIVYTFGIWMWRSTIALSTATWYAIPDATGAHLTLAGYWLTFVSVPFFQFVLLRWYARILLWYWFLWRVSRLNLRLMPTHPDRAGGLGFLAQSAFAFGPILFAQGALLSGLIANAIFHEGKHLLSYKVDIVGLVAFFVVFILGPLFMFSVQLARAKRQGLREYGLLASRYTQEFHEKWVGGGAGDEQLLGSADIQSLADLGNSVAVIRDMRVVPFGMDSVTTLVFATIAPMLPLVLTIIPVEEIIDRLFKIVL